MDTVRTNTTINGNEADLFISSSSDAASAILWTTTDDTAFYISAFLSEEELIKIAQNVEKVEK